VLHAAARRSLKVQDAKIRHLRTIAQICRAVFLQTRNAWQSPVVSRQTQRTQVGEVTVTPSQRSNRRLCSLLDVICNEGVPFRPHRWGVLSAQRVFFVLVTLTFDL